MNLDPLGTLGIWSFFGQQIFQNRISSVSNDARNYTLNLFHHFVIRSLLVEHEDSWDPKFKAFYRANNYQKFKNAALIYLENLFVYSVSECEDVETLGVLGRLAWETQKKESLIFSCKDKSYVLTRQNTLGVSGRYKTPLIKMGFFDSQYHYQNSAVWEAANQFISDQGGLNALQEVLIKHLLSLCEQSVIEPDVLLSSVPRDILKLYGEAFKSSKVVGTYSRDFWLEVSGLSLGSSYAFLSVVTKDFSIEPQEAFLKVKRSSEFENLAAAEQKKVNDIFMVEPLLADMDLLFRIMISKASQGVSEVISLWIDDYKRSSETLVDLANKVDLDALSIEGTSRTRLAELVKIRECNSLEEQVDYLLRYHAQVMEQRAQPPWIIKDKDGKLKARVCRKLSRDLDARQPGKWYNEYYIPEFRNLIKGFYGQD